MGASLYLDTSIQLFQHLPASPFSISQDNPVLTTLALHSVNIYVQHPPDFPLMCLHPIRDSVLSNFDFVLFLFLPFYRL